MNILEEIKKYKVVPVVVLNELENAVPTVEALIKGGLPVAEICFRTPVAKDAIIETTKKFPDALIGAGTVINKVQCKDAIKAGAKFIVSPGFSKEVADTCKKAHIPYLPGVVTPTEVMMALDNGITTMKFFPASNYGGLKTIKAICSAFPQIHIMPTGGINRDNIKEYLEFDKIIACGGSFMMKGSIQEIEEKTRDLMNYLK